MPLVMVSENSSCISTSSPISFCSFNWACRYSQPSTGGITILSSPPLMVTLITSSSSLTLVPASGVCSQISPASYSSL